MKDYLQHYTMKLTALAPIHVGNGRLIGKKEYIQYGMKSPVTILNQEKMIRDLCLLHKENAYAAFMLSDDRRASLAAWLTEQRIDKTRIQKWASYTLDAGDAFITPSGKGAPPKEINCFCKDAYGMAYIPGSTLKGMIRTALLVHAVKKIRRAMNVSWRSWTMHPAAAGRETAFFWQKHSDWKCRHFIH